MRFIVPALLAVAACAPRASDPAPAPRSVLATLPGTEHPPRVSGLTERGSYLVDEDGGRWVVAELVATASGERGLVLEEVVSPGSVATARWRTAAIQRLEARDSLLTIQLGTCALSGSPDRAIVALGTAATKPEVREAWRADTVARRFLRLDSRKVTCTDVSAT